MHRAIFTAFLVTLTGAMPLKKDAHAIIARAAQLGGSIPGLGGGSSGGLPSIGGGSSGGAPGIGGGSGGGLPSIGGGSGGGLPSIGGGGGGGGGGGSGGSLPSIGGGSGGGIPTPSLPFPTPGSSGAGSPLGGGLGGGSIPTPGAGGLGGGLPGIGGGSGGSSGGLPGIGGGSGSSPLGGGSSGGSIPGIGGGSSGGLPGIGGGSSGSGSSPLGGGLGGGSIPSGTSPSSFPTPSLGGEPEAGPPFDSGNHNPQGPHPLGSGSSGGATPPEGSKSHTKRQLAAAAPSSTAGAGGLGGGLGGGSIPGLGGSGGSGGASIPGVGGGSSTASDVQNGKCAPVTFIFARGTGESGNVGSVVGPPTIQDLQQSLGANNVAAQGVNYPADATGNVPGGDTTGKQSMTDLANQAVQKCPQTQLILSGYSQGAIVAHDTMAQLPAATAQKVKAVVTFGDPDSKTAVKNIDAANVKVFCASGDAVCEGTADITPAHLSYGDDAQPAAQFIQSKVQVSK